MNKTNDQQDNQQPKNKRSQIKNRNKYGITVGETYGNYRVLEEIKVPQKVSRGNGNYVECMATKWKCLYLPTNEIKITTSGYLSEFKTEEQQKEYLNNLVKENKHQMGFRHNLYLSTQKNAEKRGHEMLLTKEEFESLISQNCFYCGSPPKPASETAIKNKGNPKQPTFYYNGIDRVDSTKNYTIDNCVPCCSTCNYMKRILSIDEFKNQIIKIYDHLNLGSTTIENTSKDVSEQSTLQANGNGNIEPLTDNAEGEEIV